MRPCRRGAALVVWSALFGCTDATAQTIVPGINVTLTTLATHDSNLLRLPDGVTPAQLGFDTESRDDDVLSPLVELDLSLVWGRQALMVQGYFQRNYFDQFDIYNTRTQSYDAEYLWQWGNHWRGALEAGRNEQLTGFQDFIGPLRNLLTVRSAIASANWWPRPDRRLSLSIASYDGENSVEQRRINDYQVVTPRIEVAAITGAGNELLASYRYSKGDYPNRIVTPESVFDASYTQSDAEVGIRYAPPGGKSTVDARFGYGWRRYETLSDRDYSGPVGRFIVTWAPTGKTFLELSAIRDLSAVDELDNLFGVSTVYSAGVRYQLSTQFSFAAVYLRNRIDYKGDPRANSPLRTLFGIPDDDRTDTITQPKIALEWRPALKWLVNLSREWQERTSTRPSIFDRSSLQYKANVTTLAVQYSFGPW